MALNQILIMESKSKIKHKDMKPKGELLHSFRKTSLADMKTKKFMGALIRREFDKKDISKEIAEELLSIAYVLKTPQFDEMLDDFLITEFKY
jgi:hypothetical protein